jgi:hypothetical protein
MPTEHSDNDQWITVTDFQNNEKTMEHSDHYWIMTGWDGEQWYS